MHALVLVPAPQQRAPRLPRPVVEVPDGEPREWQKMRVGGSYTVWYYGEATPDGRERPTFVKSAQHDRFFVLVNGENRTMLHSRIGRATSVDGAFGPVTRAMSRRGSA